MNSNRIRLTCLVLLAAVSITVYGQSGRRQNKPATAPVPTPTPEATPEPTPAKEAEFGFIVGVDRDSTFDSFPFTYYSAVQQGCADQLRKGYTGRVEISERNLNRGDALKLAKQQTKTYVVLLKLSDGTFNSTYKRANDQDLQLEFVVFAPVTGKQVVSGNSYQNVARKGPIGIAGPGSGTSSTIYREQLLKHAAEDAGERILKALNLRVTRSY